MGECGAIDPSLPTLVLVEAAAEVIGGPSTLTTPVTADGGNAPRRSVVGDVVLGLAVILVFGVGVLFLDRGDLGVAHAFDLMSVGKVRVVRGGDVIVGVVSGGGLEVLVGRDLEVVRCLAVVLRRGVIELVLALGNHQQVSLHLYGRCITSSCFCGERRHQTANVASPLH